MEAERLISNDINVTYRLIRTESMQRKSPKYRTDLLGLIASYITVFLNRQTIVGEDEYA